MMLEFFIIVCVLAGLAAIVGALAALTFRFLEGLAFRFLDGLDVNEAAQAEYALRLRREAGLRDFLTEFAQGSVSRADLKCAFDLLWLDVLWRRPLEVKRTSRVGDMYEEGRRLEDVAATLARRCGMEQAGAEWNGRTPETVGELVDFINEIRRRSRDFDARRLLRASEGSTELLRAVAPVISPRKDLVRPAQSDG